MIDLFPQLLRMLIEDGLQPPASFEYFFSWRKVLCSKLHLLPGVAHIHTSVQEYEDPALSSPLQSSPIGPLTQLWELIAAQLLLYQPCFFLLTCTTQLLATPSKYPAHSFLFQNLFPVEYYSRPRRSLDTLCLPAPELWLNRGSGPQFSGISVELGTVDKHQWWDLKWRINISQPKVKPLSLEDSDLAASNLFSFDQNITWDAPVVHALRALHILVRMNWASAHLFPLYPCELLPHWTNSATRNMHMN